MVCTHERMLKMFRITGLSKVFPIHDSVEQAVAQLRADSAVAAGAP